MHGWHSALCRVLPGTLHQMRQNRKFWPGESISLQTFTPVMRKVSPKDFLTILGSSQPKITNQSFWPSYDQMVLLTGVRPKPGFGHFEVRPWVKFSKFWLREISDLYANGPESFPPKFLTLFGAPRPEITTRSFWPSCDQMVPLTGVRPKSMFGLFDHCATRKDLKNPGQNLGISVGNLFFRQCCHAIIFLFVIRLWALIFFCRLPQMVLLNSRFAGCRKWVVISSNNGWY